MSEFATSIVNRLFLVGLSLESARSIVGSSPAGDRIASAAGEVDELIREIRATVFSPGADPLGSAEKAHGPHSARIAGTGTGDRRAAGATG